MAFNLFEEVLTHHRQQVAGVFKEQALVIGHILVIRLGNTFPKGAAGGSTVGIGNGHTFASGHHLTQFLLFQDEGRVSQGLWSYLWPQFFKVSTILGLYPERKVLSVVTYVFWTLYGGLFY